MNNGQASVLISGTFINMRHTIIKYRQIRIFVTIFAK